jgi:hypothetical protein
MGDSFQERLRAVDADVLTPLVQQALDTPTAELLNWEQLALGGGIAHASQGVLARLRFRGEARVQGQVMPWSLVLKVFAPPPGYANDDPTAWNYWKREALAYKSGMVAHLDGGLLDGGLLDGGLAAPRCFAIVEYPDEETWVWMEYIAEESKTWPLERYQLAARHLGHFNGAYLVGRPLPDYPWLNQRHSFQWLQMGIPGLQDLPRLSQSQWTWLTEESTQRTLRLYAECDRLVEGLEKLPTCLCHHDSFRRNMLARHMAQGEEETVLIDWSAVGPGSIGEDLAKLVVISVLLYEAPLQEIVRLDRLAFAGYLAGLRDVGWQGDEALVRFGYTTSAVLYAALGLTGRIALYVENEEGRSFLAQMNGYPFEVLQSHWRGLQDFLLDLGDEALKLLERVPTP